MKRLNAFTDAHPLLAIVLGYLVLVAIVLVVVPADPASVAQAMHERGRAT